MQFLPYFRIVLYTLFLALSSVLASENERTCQTNSLQNIETSEAIRTTTIYSSGAMVGVTSLCHLATNHLQTPRMLPQVRCLVLGVGTGIVTAATHARLTYTEEVWKMVEGCMEGYWRS